MSMIRSVVRTEMRQFIRDGRLRLLGILVLILALAALAFGVAQTQRSQEARESARKRATTQWEGQGKKNGNVDLAHHIENRWREADANGS